MNHHTAPCRFAKRLQFGVNNANKTCPHDPPNSVRKVNTFSTASGSISVMFLRKMENNRKTYRKIPLLKSTF